jgi:hypothetical protein
MNRERGNELEGSINRKKKKKKEKEKKKSGRKVDSDPPGTCTHLQLSPTRFTFHYYFPYRAFASFCGE